jgi:regulator of protease activity HflC (stomatin/prohibitin superfamily)
MAEYRVPSVDQGKLIRYVGLAILVILGVVFIWPFYSVPTGSRGVVTTFGAITGIESEGLAVLPPWRKLTIFSIRAEQANVDEAEGSTNDQQPVKVSLTVRYSIATDRVSEVFEKYSHNGDLS